ncbi:MAG: NAD(P)-dependent oxidoreductase [Proteobacteria bacterium]|nr:NAD(P)-dependent oxidoreductase [Pseudomonadota bacterium]
MRFLVLGSEGVVGKSFCEFIENKTEHSCTHWDIKNGSEFDLRDTNNISKLKKTMEDCDFVMFLACDVGGSKYLNTVQNVTFINNNLLIMINVFNTLLETKKPFIFTSSQMSNMHHCSYGTCKKIGEHYCSSIGGIVVQLWNTYGYEKVDVKSHVINDFIRMALDDKTIHMKTDGSEKRQFLFDTDCAEALFVLAQNYKKYEFQTIHLTNGEWTSIYEIAQIIKDEIKDIEIITNTKKDDTQILVNEPKNFIDTNDWLPKISIRDGIKYLIQLQSLK